MKKLFIFAASAALFAACSQSDDLALGTAQQAQAQAEETPVAFDVYAQKGTTRAGVAGDITTGQLQTGTYKDAGFGVFGYYTNDEAYTQLATPNFMYNQQVKFDGTSAWNYSPVKYWPNEFGSDASSNFKDYLSFFAYAPYVEVDEITGLPKATKMNETEALGAMGTTKDLLMKALTSGIKTTYTDGTADEKAAVDAKIAAFKAQISSRAVNIIGVSKNSITGDPFVKYVATLDPTNAVDLLWAVQPDLSARTPGDGSYEPIQGSYAYTTGMPWLNLTKEKDADKGKVKFYFRHALAKLNVQIDADVDSELKDGEGNDGSKNLGTKADGTTKDEKTRIFVRSVTFKGFATEGALDLNNTTKDTPLWLNLDYKSTLAGASTTVYDGRQNGSEMVSANATEAPTTLNPVIIAADGTSISSYAWSGSNGVTTTLVNLFKNYETGTPATDLTQAMYVIPNGDVFEVTIDYDVETIDQSLPGLLSDGITHGSIVKNRITKASKKTPAALVLEAGKSYTVKLHLGMTSVKFEAEVNGTWDDGGADNIALPINGPTAP
jgi:hypothetical protein